MSVTGPKARIESMLHDHGVHFMLHDNPQNHAYIIQRFSHEVQGCEVNLKQLATDLSEKYGIHATYKKFNKGRSGRGDQVSFDKHEITNLISLEKDQKLKEAQEAELARKAKALEQEMQALSLNVEKEKPTGKKDSNSKALENAIKVGLKDIITNQTVHFHKQSTGEYRHYNGQYSIQVGRNFVAIRFKANALPNWSTTKSLCRHIAEQLGEKCDKKNYNRTKSGVAILTFSRKTCDKVFGGQLDIDKRMLLAYESMVDGANPLGSKSSPKSLKTTHGKKTNRF